MASREQDAARAAAGREGIAERAAASREEDAARAAAGREGTAERAAARREELAERASVRRAGIAARAAAGREAVRSRFRRFRGGGAPPGGEGPPSGSPPPRGSAYGRRRILALGLTLVGLLFVWFLYALFQPFKGDELEGDPVTVQIPEGTDAGEAADILVDEGVIDGGWLFEIRLRLAGKSGDIQADTYTLAEDISYGAAIDAITGEREPASTVTIPEGYSRQETAEIVADAGVEGEYLAATESARGFNPAKYGAKKPESLEGFLFPATYELLPGLAVQDLVTMQLDAFEERIGEIDMSFARTKNLTVYDVLIIASMVEREVQVPKERPLVAAVIYNRLKQGIPLGIDATVRFAVDNFSEPLTNEELETDSPYNTRINAGLPPGPIGSPGIDSIEAAANPARQGKKIVPYLFYVVKPGTCGEHTFTTTEAQFEQAVARYNEAREAAGGKSPDTC